MKKDIYRNLTTSVVTLIADDGSIRENFLNEAIDLPEPQRYWECDGEGDAYGCMPTPQCCGCNHCYEKEKTYFIVSKTMAQAAKASGRETGDLRIPVDLVIDEAGNVLGYRRLARFH